MKTAEERSRIWRRRQWWLPAPVFQAVTARRRDVLFLWVPKCAGMSIYRTLVKYGCDEERWDRPMEPFSNRGIVTFGHVDVMSLLEQGLLSRRFFDRAFKFAFVRNPYDRMVSLFFYLKKVLRPEVPEAMTFPEFCLAVEREAGPQVGLYNYQGLSQCNPMLSWLTDRNGKIIADFIGRHENLEQDFQHVCRQIGIKETIPHENKSEHKPYRHYYTDQTRAIVEKLYRKDLDAFDYSF